MALLRCLVGLWLLGGMLLTFLRRSGGPNSVGAGSVWHFCVARMAPCNWWERRTKFGITACTMWPLPWGIVIKALLRHVSVPCNWLGRALSYRHLCERLMALPLGQQCLDISAFSK